MIRSNEVGDEAKVTFVLVAVVVLVSGMSASAQPPGGTSPLSGNAQPMDAQTMNVCRPMMMGHPGFMGDTMSMMSMMAGNPRQQAEMMAMRGEMMKAMGDVMMKYAERMRTSK
jgi:hypothetical protein